MANTPDPNPAADRLLEHIEQGPGRDPDRWVRGYDRLSEQLPIYVEGDR